MRQKSVILFLFSLVLLMVSCRTGDKPDYVPFGSGEIRIGALIPITGSDQASGVCIRTSLEFARQDVIAYLASVGKRATVVLDIADTKSDTAETLRKIIGLYSRGIRFVIGPYRDAEVAAIEKFADTHGMVIVSPSSGAASLAVRGDNIFRYISCDRVQGTAMNKMLTEDKIKVVLPLIRDDLWGTDLFTSTRNNFLNSGGDMEDPVLYDPDAAGFTAALSQLDANVEAQLQQHDPNEVAVYLVSSSEGANIMAAAKHYIHLNNIYWYGCSGMASNPRVLADSGSTLFAYTHGLPCPVYGLDDAARTKWEPLKERITALGLQPDIYAFTAYDALWVGALTYLSAGTSPGADLFKSAFIQVSGSYFGVTGNTALDDNGDRAAGIYDFLAVKHDTTGYCWKRVARYNALTGILTRVTE